MSYTVIFRAPVKVDAQGFDDIDDFWEKAEVVYEEPSKKTNFSSSSASLPTNSADLDSYSVTDDEDDDGNGGDIIPAVKTAQKPQQPLNRTDNSSPANNQSSPPESLLKTLSSSPASLINAGDSFSDDGDDIAPQNMSSGRLNISDSPANTPFSINASILSEPSTVKEGRRSLETVQKRVSFGAESLMNDSMVINESTSSSIAISPQKSAPSSSPPPPQDPTHSTSFVSRAPKGVTKKRKQTANTLTPGAFDRLMKTPKSDEFPRGGRQSIDESYGNTEAEDSNGEGESEDESSGTLVEDTSYLHSVRRRQAMREENDEEEEEEEERGGVRRSSRVTKGIRLQHWKGERSVYQGGELIGITAAEPTPSRPKTKKKSAALRDKNLRRKLLEHRLEREDDRLDEEEEMKEVGKTIGRVKKPARVVLPKDRVYLSKSKCEVLPVWDNNAETTVHTKVVCVEDSLLPAMPLPASSPRPAGKEHLLGFAGQSFNIPCDPVANLSGMISGFLDLPPGAIKGFISLYLGLGD